MSSLDFLKQMEISKQRITDPDQMAGLDLFQGWSTLTSGSRKILAATQRQQVLALFTPEIPQIMTGYEQRFGDYSSSIIKADREYRCIAKIPKFSFSPDHHYYLICEDDTGEVEVFERVSYHHVTQKYGYLYNCSYMDGLIPGSIIYKDDIIRKSITYDKFNNQCTGVNLNILYMALDQNMEDSIIISDVAAKKLAAPLIKKVNIMINENDIPVNYYGDDTVYKAMPDIGEHTKDAVLMSLRKDKKEDALFMQSVDRLKKLVMSDDTYLLNGTVMDIDIYCNNPENLEYHYNGQFKMYYNEQRRCAQEIISTLTPLVASGKTLTYPLQKLYANSQRIIRGDQYLEKKQFSNTEIEITVLERRELQVGDKVSNRYGGKGVTSKIIPQALMPRCGDEPMDILMNSSTMVNRENPGQLFEMSINFIGTQLLRHIATGKYSIDKSIKMILQFIKDVSPAQHDALKQYVDTMDDEQKAFFLDSMIHDDHINLTVEVMKDPITIDRLDAIYKHFPFIQQLELTVPIKDSNNEIRFIPARRKVVYGKEYVLRLEQYAEEKFSATSLSATNLRGENTKSKASRDYRLLYSNTPIRMGNMEILDLDHLGPDVVIATLLLHSVSPHARKLVEQFSIGDPYSTDIKLDDESVNRQAEEVETYLRAIGLRLKFTKHPKKMINPFKQFMYKGNSFTYQSPFIKIPEEYKTEEEKKKYVKEVEARKARFRNGVDKKGKKVTYKDPFVVYDPLPEKYQ